MTQVGKIDSVEALFRSTQNALKKKENENVYILIRLKRLLSSREKEPESQETELRYFLFRTLNQCYCTHNLQLCSIILLYLGNKESVKI